MTAFSLILQDSQSTEKINDVVIFSGTDVSGSFNILAGHERFMTVLEFGLAKYRCQDQQWQYLAMPGAVLYFNHNELSLNSRIFLRDNNYKKISQQLSDRIKAEEQDLQSIRKNLHQLENEVLKRLWRSNEHRDLL